MRLVCLLFLVAVAAAATIFVMENDQSLTLTFLGQALTARATVILGVTYGLGMLTGWSLLGLLRRSFATATDFRSREAVR
jgi:hypothetical protein